MTSTPSPRIESNVPAHGSAPRGRGGDLDSLFASLRDAGLRVGIDEELRARHVLACMARAEAEGRLVHPSVEGDPAIEWGASIEAALASIVVKSREARDVFRTVFVAWQELSLRVLRSGLDSVELTQERPVDAPTMGDTTTTARPSSMSGGAVTADQRGFMGVPGNSSTPPCVARSQGPSSRRDWRPFLAFGGALVLAIAALGWWLERSPSDRLREVGVNEAEGTPAATRVQRSPAQRAQPSPAETAPASALLISIGAGALMAGGFWLWLRRRIQGWLPMAEPQPSEGGGLGYVLPRASIPRRATPLALLTKQEEEALVWGIGRFTSAETTRQLDVRASVRATAAAAGCTSLRFHAQRHEREVWLWIDESAGVGEGLDQSLEQIAADIRQALTRAGLGVECASFHVLPDELRSDRGSFTPLEVEDRRDAAIVTVLTDGRELCHRLELPGGEAPLRSVLRQLSHFPALVFVDFARGASDLAARLRPYQLQVIHPEALPEFLSGGGTAAAEPRELRGSFGSLVGDARAWAAVLALPPFPVDIATAQLARERFRLQVSPWMIDALRLLAPGPGGRLEWKREMRADLLAWLLAISDGPTRGLLSDALSYWRRVLDQEEERRRKLDEPWQGTVAECHLHMERALLDLWDRAEQGIVALYALHASEASELQGVRQALREHLNTLGPASCQHGSQGAVALPWSLSERTESELAMMQLMGFGGNHCGSHQESVLRTSGRWYLGLGIAAGVFCTALALAIIGPSSRRSSPSTPPDRTSTAAASDAQTQ
jgi:hypothetical protein